MDLNQVTLPVRNIQEVVSFSLQLGFTQIVDRPYYARFSCPRGNSTFSIVLETDEFINGAVIYFEAEKLDELVASLIKKGIHFIQLPTDQPYLWREAILKDPSGNQIKFYWAGENRLNPPWKLEKR